MAGESGLVAGTDNNAMPFAGVAESTDAVRLLGATSLAIGEDVLCGRF